MTIKYNTFVVFDCKKRRVLLVTSSSRKAKEKIQKGIKVEVWSENQHIETIYNRNINQINKYVMIEKQYIAQKQTKATQRNKRRKQL